MSILNLILICEGPSDAPVIQGLVDRIATINDDGCGMNRIWHSVHRNTDGDYPYVTWSSVKTLARDFEIRIYGKFTSDPFAAEVAKAMKVISHRRFCLDRPAYFSRPAT